jgi:hypothetical protein
MGVIKSGHNSVDFPNNFGASDAVTADALNDHVNDSTFNTTAVDDSTIEVYDSGAKIRVKDDGVTFAKMQNISTDKVLGRTTAGSGVIEEVDLLDENDMNSDSDTAVATQQSIKAYIDTEITNLGVVVNNYVMFETTNARNAENSFRWKNYTEIAKNNSLSSFGSFDSDGSIFTFTSTGTYLVEFDGRFLDDDGDGGDSYGMGFGKGDGSDEGGAITTTFWTRGGVTRDGFNRHLARHSSAAGSSIPLMGNLSGIIAVSNQSTDKLQVVTYPINGGNYAKWEGLGYLKITKLT